MTDPTTASPVDRAALRAVLISMWLMMLIIFSAPNRTSPTGLGDLDLIAIAKVLARVTSMALLSFGIWRIAWRHPHHRLAVWCMTPLGAFVLLAIISTVWSPLKAQTLGQAAGLLVVYLMAVALALVATDEWQTEVVLRHLTIGLFLISLALFCADLVSHDLSGLNRDPENWDGALGILHPTASGATASLGLVLLVACWLLWAWPWTSRLLVPGLVLHSILLHLAASRMAGVMAIVVLGAMAATLVPRAWVALATLVACVASAAYLVVDPGHELVGVALAFGGDYASKGESVETLTTLTGRTELWARVWEEFLKAPVLGHGYFITSETGEIDVWSGPANRPAHNILLQALVSSGVVGTVLLIWGLLRPARLLPYALGAPAHVKALAALSLLIGLWFLGWGQLSESFLGPVRPESVVWFVTIGLVVGNLAAAGQRRHDAEART